MMNEDETGSAERQFAIWRSRVHREFEKCEQPHALPDGVTLRRTQVDEASGRCEGEFHCFVPFQEGSEALALIPLTSLVVSMSFDRDRVARGKTQFPFLTPQVRVRIGHLYLPSEMLQRVERAKKKDQAQADASSRAYAYMLRMPMLSHWTPSNTLVMLMHEFVKMVQQNDPQPSIAAANASASAGDSPNRSKRTMRMRKRDIHGAIYPSQEVDPHTSSLRSTPLLLQSGNIAVLFPPEPTRPAASSSSQKEADPYVYVRDLISLRDIARITPQRGKSITLFFKDRALPCRTFFTSQTEAIVSNLQRMIASAGAKRARDEPNNNASGNALSQLLPFLSSDHAERAKEMSNKFMGKLGKFTNSVSRFFSGDDVQEEKRQAKDPLAGALEEIHALKDIFFRTPSKARMVDITRRYQSLAEEYAHRSDTQGHVERAIQELQSFIEHSTTQRILLEACSIEQSNKGIRVGPA